MVALSLAVFFFFFFSPAQLTEEQIAQRGVLSKPWSQVSTRLPFSSSPGTLDLYRIQGLAFPYIARRLFI